MLRCQLPPTGEAKCRALRGKTRFNFVQIANQYILFLHSELRGNASPSIVIVSTAGQDNDSAVFFIVNNSVTLIYASAP